MMQSQPQVSAFLEKNISCPVCGEEALQKVGSGEINLPDLVIVDVNMAGMSGFDLCREFRLKHGTASDLVPYIIVVTANEGVDVELGEAGAGRSAAQRHGRGSVAARCGCGVTERALQ